jgi:hypothetical protein
MGLIVGFGAGYVLGAKAGRARYEQIKSASERAWDSSPGRRVRESASEVLESVQARALGVLRSITSGKPGHIDLTTYEDETILR